MFKIAFVAAYVMIASGGPETQPPQIVGEPICFTEPDNLSLGQMVVGLRDGVEVEVGVVVAFCPRGAVCRKIVKCPPVPES